MSDIRTITVDIIVINGPHGCQVAGAMRRVAELCGKIAAKNPQGWYGIGRAIADAENSVTGCNYAEVEFAAYLAGLAVPIEELLQREY